MWRHWVKKIPLIYTPTLWSMIFPLGMFAVASIRLGRVDNLLIVEVIGQAALLVTFAVWVLVGIRMVRKTIEILVAILRERSI